MDLQLNGTSLYLGGNAGATFTTSVETRFNDNRQIYKTVERWTVSVRIHPDQSATTAQQRQDSIIAKVATIEGAVNSTGSNTITLLTDDGGTADTITGALLVSGPSYGGDQPGENALFRRATMTFERESFGGTNIVSFSETVTYSGGGPRKVLQEIRNGYPQEYQVSQATAFYAVQVGQAMHRVAPYYRDPYWPDSIINPESKSVTGGSKVTDGYPSSWNYSFAAAGSFPIIIPARPL